MTRLIFYATKNTMGVENQFLSDFEARNILSSIGIGTSPSESELLRLRFSARDIVEVNLKLMQQLGRAEEAAGFKFILDNDLASDYMYRFKVSKKYLNSVEFKKQILLEWQNEKGD